MTRLILFNPLKTPLIINKLEQLSTNSKALEILKKRVRILWTLVLSRHESGFALGRIKK